MTTLTPVESDQYLSLSTLGSNGLAENYYPTNSSIINPYEQVHWIVQVYNHIGKVEWVSIRFKISNSTIASPNDINSTPSPSPYIAEFNRLINNNETWTLSLPWEIIDANQSGNYVMISSLSINGSIINGFNASALHGYNFRVILELWTFNPTTSQFQFAWNSVGQSDTAWNQIWFNVTSA